MAMAHRRRETPLSRIHRVLTGDVTEHYLSHFNDTDAGGDLLRLCIRSAYTCWNNDHGFQSYV